MSKNKDQLFQQISRLTERALTTCCQPDVEVLLKEIQQITKSHNVVQVATKTKPVAPANTNITFSGYCRAVKVPQT